MSFRSEPTAGEKEREREREEKRTTQRERGGIGPGQDKGGNKTHKMEEQNTK